MHRQESVWLSFSFPSFHFDFPSEDLHIHLLHYQVLACGELPLEWLRHWRDLSVGSVIAGGRGGTDTDNAEKVKMLVELHAQGLSLPVITEAMKNKGIQALKGKVDWDRQFVRRELLKAGVILAKEARECP